MPYSVAGTEMTEREQMSGIGNMYIYPRNLILPSICYLPSINNTQWDKIDPYFFSNWNIYNLYIPKNIGKFPDTPFLELDNTPRIFNVYYEGTREEWLAQHNYSLNQYFPIEGASVMCYYNGELV